MYVQMQLAFEQQQPDSEEPQEYCPGRCPHELSTADMNNDGNVKSECDLTCKALGHSMWTNCRVWGSCTLRGDI